MKTNNIPSAILKALLHVRQFHPTVTFVIFGSTGGGSYGDEEGGFPSFGDEIDDDILNAADQEAAEGKLPVEYSLDLLAVAELDRDLHEAIADIAWLAGRQMYYGGDSRKDIQDFIRWAKEFTALHADNDWSTGNYIEEIAKFAVSKFEDPKSWGS